MHFLNINVVKHQLYTSFGDSGPKTDPCGTPQVTVAMSEQWL